MASGCSTKNRRKKIVAVAITPIMKGLKLCKELHITINCATIAVTMLTPLQPDTVLSVDIPSKF
jgi:hypothetical protein